MEMGYPNAKSANLSPWQTDLFLYFLQGMKFLWLVLSSIEA